MSTIRKCLRSSISIAKSYGHPQVLRYGGYFKSCGKRCLSSGAYEGDGKTHAVLMNDDNEHLMINSYSELGFTMNNEVTVLGPIAIFPNLVLSWNVGDIVHLNKETLSLFLKLEPKLDILVLGLPDYNKTNRAAFNKVALLLRDHRIQCEILPTEIACPTFNFLNAEERFVAAGIIPPHHVTASEATAMTGALKLGYSPKDKNN